MSNTSKIVLITGATAGIGRKTALHLAQHGHHVIATGRKSAELATLAAEAAALTVTNGGKLDTLLLDVTQLVSITSAAQVVGGGGRHAPTRTRPSGASARRCCSC